MLDINKQIHKNDFDGNIQLGGKSFHDSTKRTHINSSADDEELWGRNFFDINPHGTYTHKKEFFTRLLNCPLCASKEINLLLNKKGLTISQCSECTFAFQNPRFNESRLHSIYNKPYVMDEVYKSEASCRFDELKYLYGLQQVQSFLNPIESILDLGCGTGESLKAYRKAGIQEVHGVDPVDYDIADRNIKRCYFEEIPNHFKDISLVTLWDTLEHLHNFKLVIKQIHKTLAPNGFVLIMVPNLLSLASRLIRDRSPTFQIDHLSYFTEKSLSRLLKECNFEVLKRETVISEIDNCRNYLEFQEPYDSTPRNEPIFRWLTPEYIHKNMLGSRLLFIAKKIST